MLTIPEEVVLVHTRPWGERRVWDGVPSLFISKEAVAAGRLIELVLAKRVMVERQRRHLVSRDAIVVIDAAPTGDALLDEALTRLGTAEGRSCGRWITQLAKGSPQAYWDRLVAQSVLRPDTLGGDSRGYVADDACVAAIIGRIRAVLEQPPPGRSARYGTRHGARTRWWVHHAARFPVQPVGADS